MLRKTASYRRQQPVRSPRHSSELYRVEDSGRGLFPNQRSRAHRRSGRCYRGARARPTSHRRRSASAQTSHPVALRLRRYPRPPIEEDLHGLRGGNQRRNAYKGGYQAVYPIKVNQQRPTVEAVFRSRARIWIRVGGRLETPDSWRACRQYRGARAPVIRNGIEEELYRGRDPGDQAGARRHPSKSIIEESCASIVGVFRAPSGQAGDSGSGSSSPRKA